MTNTKPKIQTTENIVCATCWIRGQGHTPNTCHCGRGEFVNEGVLDYIKQIGREQGKQELVELLESLILEEYQNGSLRERTNVILSARTYRTALIRLKSQLKEAKRA